MYSDQHGVCVSPWVPQLFGNTLMSSMLSRFYLYFLWPCSIQEAARDTLIQSAQLTSEKWNTAQVDFDTTYNQCYTAGLSRTKSNAQVRNTVRLCQCPETPSFPRRHDCRSTFFSGAEAWAWGFLFTANPMRWTRKACVVCAFVMFREAQSHWAKEWGMRQCGSIGLGYGCKCIADAVAECMAISTIAPRRSVFYYGRCAAAVEVNFIFQRWCGLGQRMADSQPCVIWRGGRAWCGGQDTSNRGWADQ
jgi:phage-related protein